MHDLDALYIKSLLRRHCVFLFRFFFCAPTSTPAICSAEDVHRHEVISTTASTFITTLPLLVCDSGNANVSDLVLIVTWPGHGIMNIFMTVALRTIDETTEGGNRDAAANS